MMPKSGRMRWKSDESSLHGMFLRYDPPLLDTLRAAVNHLVSDSEQKPITDAK